MKELFIALCLAFALEGMIYALFPNGMRRLLREFLEAPEAQVRITGLVIAGIAVSLIWLVR